jgi:hypothetical protein
MFIKNIKIMSIKKFNEYLNENQLRMNIFDKPHRFEQGDPVKIINDDGSIEYGEFHRYGETRHSAIIFVDGDMRFVDEQSLKIPDYNTKPVVEDIDNTEEDDDNDMEKAVRNLNLPGQGTEHPPFNKPDENMDIESALKKALYEATWWDSQLTKTERTTISALEARKRVCDRIYKKYINIILNNVTE